MDNTIRKKALRWCAGFFAAAFFCTMVSRGIYGAALPVVETTYAKRMPLSHEVIVEGSVKQRQESAVPVKSGLRIQTVLVGAGERVEEGSPLLQVDMEDLSGLMEKHRIEIQKLSMNIHDIKANERLSKQQAEQAEKRAMEDYILSYGGESEKINNAWQSVEEAKAELAALPDEGSYVDYYVNHDSQYQSYKIQMDRLREEIGRFEAEDQQSLSGNEIESQLQEKKDALADLERNTAAYKDALAAGKAEEWRTKKKGLEQTVDAQAESYDSTVEAGKDKVLSAGRGLEDSQIPGKEDSTLELTMLEKQQKEKELAEYEAIYEAGGVVTAAQAGSISRIGIKAGERTGDGAVLALATGEAGRYFTANLTEEQAEYVQSGAEITLEFGKEGKKYPDRKAESVALSEEGGFEVRVDMSDIEEDAKTGRFRAVSTGKTHAACVPLSALYADGQKDYVLVMDTVQTVLGEEYLVRRVDVKVEEKNDMYAGLAQGTLSGDEQVVVKSTKPLRDGDTVRQDAP